VCELRAVGESMAPAGRMVGVIVGLMLTEALLTSGGGGGRAAGGGPRHAEPGGRSHASVASPSSLYREEVPALVFSLEFP
jgi:hypothetical protein